MTYSNESRAIAAGKMACDMMNSGTSEKDVVDKLSMLNPGLNSGGAMKFAALASSAYCPDYLNKSSTPTKSRFTVRGFGGMVARSACSPGWTRTTNPSVNSRMLCQLSYRGLLGVRVHAGADRGMTLAYRRPHAQPD